MSLPSIMEDHSWFSLSSMEKSAVSWVCFPALCRHPSWLNPDPSSSFSILTVNWRPLMSPASWLEWYNSPNTEDFCLDTSEWPSWRFSSSCWLSGTLAGLGYCKAEPARDTCKTNEWHPLTATFIWFDFYTKYSLFFNSPTCPAESLIHSASSGLSSLIVNETAASSISGNWRKKCLKAGGEKYKSFICVKWMNENVGDCKGWKHHIVQTYYHLIQFI